MAILCFCAVFSGEFVDVDSVSRCSSSWLCSKRHFQGPEGEKVVDWLAELR
jgi:hypothetical protein